MQQQQKILQKKEIHVDISVLMFRKGLPLLAVENNQETFPK